MINEITVYLSVLLMMNFMNAAIPPDFADTLGIVLISILGLNIIYNVMLTCFQTLRGICQENKNFFTKMKVQNLIK